MRLSVASRYGFESKLCGKAQDPRIVGLQYRVRSAVHRSKFANKCFDYDQRRIEHRIGRTIFLEALLTAYTDSMRDAICNTVTNSIQAAFALDFSRWRVLTLTVGLRAQPT